MGCCLAFMALSLGVFHRSTHDACKNVRLNFGVKQLFYGYSVYFAFDGRWSPTPMNLAYTSTVLSRGSIRSVAHEMLKPHQVLKILKL